MIETGLFKAKYPKGPGNWQFVYKHPLLFIADVAVHVFNHMFAATGYSPVWVVGDTKLSFLQTDHWAPSLVPLGDGQYKPSLPSSNSAPMWVKLDGRPLAELMAMDVDHEAINRLGFVNNIPNVPTTPQGLNCFMWVGGFGY